MRLRVRVGLTVNRGRFAVSALKLGTGELGQPRDEIDLRVPEPIDKDIVFTPV